MKQFLQTRSQQNLQPNLSSCIKRLSPLALASLALFYPPVIPAASASSAVNIPQAIASLQQTQQRWLEVDLSKQRLIAWEGETQVYAVVISGGTEFDPTLPGSFTIQSKYESSRMQGQGYDGTTYDIPDVPFAMYYDGNYAIHGAYWHDNFGTPVSHGCVNVTPADAEWLYNWMSYGTLVNVHY